MTDKFSRTVTVTQEDGMYKLSVVDPIDGARFSVVNVSEQQAMNTINSMRPIYWVEEET